MAGENRDERLQEFRRRAWASRKIGSVIRAFCYECMCSSPEIEKCPANRCPLFPFRLGGSRRKGFDSAMGLLAAEGRSDLAEQSKRVRDEGRGSFPGKPGVVAVGPDDDDESDDSALGIIMDSDPVQSIADQEPEKPISKPKFRLGTK